MFLSILLLAAGFVLLIIGADKLVEGAASLARRYRIPDIVIGLTIVAFGTSAPELVVNAFASANGNSAIVMGNVIGSNIFNILAILGIASLIYPLAVQKSTTWIEIPLALMAALVAFTVAGDLIFDHAPAGIVTRTEGMVLLAFFIIYLVYNFQVAKTSHIENDSAAKVLSLLKSSLFIAAGLAGLFFGGKFIVDNAVKIASSLGVSDRVISLTIVSVGTSLPELATSVIAARKKNVDIAIGNVVGSNIFNIFFILGVSAVIRPAGVAEAASFDMLVNILASVLLFLFIFTGRGRKLQRAEGMILLLLYIIYVVILVTGVKIIPV